MELNTHYLVPPCCRIYAKGLEADTGFSQVIEVTRPTLCGRLGR